MAVTNILTATTAAGTSSEFTVGADPVTVVAVAAAGIGFDYAAALEIKGGTVFQTVYDKDTGKPVVLGQAPPNKTHAVCITAPGVYHVAKASTPLLAIGFETHTP